VANNKRRYRSRIQIVADILEIARSGSRKTRIMYLGNLSFEVLQKYLDMLVNLGLIKFESEDDRTYVATERGRQFLEDFHELEKYSEIVESKRRALQTSLGVVV